MLRVLPLLLLVSCFYVTAEDRRERMDLDGDGVARPADCDDDDPEVGEITWYADADLDGYGDPSTRERSCEPIEGFVENDDDCDDTDDMVRPGAVELCNGVDDDCNGAADDGASVPTWYVDDDGDQQGDLSRPVNACDQPAGAVANADDCDDTLASVKLGGVEVACNDRDDDCDTLVDLDDPDIDAGDWWWYFDGDGDDYGDEDAAAPNEPVRACDPPQDFVAELGDCLDSDPAVNPGEIEVCNGDDDNCDNVIDPDGAVGSMVYYADLDADGFGNGASVRNACVQPYDHVTNALDCNDGNGCIHPGAIEYCDGGTVDDDCNTLFDDGCIPPAGGACP